MRTARVACCLPLLCACCNHSRELEQAFAAECHPEFADPGLSDGVLVLTRADDVDPDEPGIQAEFDVLVSYSRHARRERVVGVALASGPAEALSPDYRGVGRSSASPYDQTLQVTLPERTSTVYAQCVYDNLGTGRLRWVFTSKPVLVSVDESECAYELDFRSPSTRETFTVEADRDDRGRLSVSIGVHGNPACSRVDVRELRDGHCAFESASAQSLVAGSAELIVPVTPEMQTLCVCVEDSGDYVQACDALRIDYGAV